MSYYPMTAINEATGWYFLDGEIYIISDHPGAEQRIKEHPELMSLPLANLEAMTQKSAAKKPKKSPKG